MLIRNNLAKKQHLIDGLMVSELSSIITCNPMQLTFLFYLCQSAKHWIYPKFQLDVCFWVESYVEIYIHFRMISFEYCIVYVENKKWKLYVINKFTMHSAISIRLTRFIKWSTITPDSIRKAHAILKPTRLLKFTTCKHWFVCSLLPTVHDHQHTFHTFLHGIRKNVAKHNKNCIRQIR